MRVVVVSEIGAGLAGAAGAVVNAAETAAVATGAAILSAWDYIFE